MGGGKQMAGATPPLPTPAGSSLFHPSPGFWTPHLSLRVCSLLPWDCASQSLPIPGYKSENDAHLCHLHARNCSKCLASFPFPPHGPKQVMSSSCLHGETEAHPVTSEGTRPAPASTPMPWPGEPRRVTQDRFLPAVLLKRKESVY